MANPQVTATINAEDKATPVLRAIAKIAQETARQMEKGNSEAFANLPKNLNVANTAAERNIALLSRMKDAMAGVASAAAAYAGHMAQVASRKVFEEGKHLQTENDKLVRAGIPSNEIDSARRQVAEIQKDLPQISTTLGLEVYKDIRSVLKDLHEVPHMLKPTLEIASQIKANGGNTEGLVYAVKAAELLGRANDPEKYKATLEAIVKAQQVMGKTIGPETAYDLAKYSKSSGGLLSDRFLFTTAFSLSQEMGGSSAGNALDQWNKLTSGGLQNLHTAAKEWARLGLIKKEDLEYNNNGDVKGLKSGREIVGASLARSDPDKYYYQYMKPALERAGYKTFEERASEIRRLAPNKNVADLLVKLDQQQQAFENHAKLYGEALGTNADLTKNAAVQLDAFNTTLKDISAQVGEPMMEPFAKLLNSISTKLREAMPAYNDFAKDNPGLAAAIGAITTAGLKFGGAAAQFGGEILAIRLAIGGSASALGGSASALGGSATALDGSAAALTRAASALGLTNKLPNGAVPVGAKPSAINRAVGATAGLAAEAAAPAALATVESIAIGTLGTIVLGAGAAAAFGYLAKEAFEAFRRLYNGEHKDATPLAPEYQPGGYDPKVQEWWNTYGREQQKFGFSPSESIGEAWDEIQKDQKAIAEQQRAIDLIDKAKPQNEAQRKAMEEMRRKRQAVIDGLKAQVQQLQEHIDKMGDLINKDDLGKPKDKPKLKALKEAADPLDVHPEPPKRPDDLRPVSIIDKTPVGDLSGRFTKGPVQQPDDHFNYVPGVPNQLRRHDIPVHVLPIKELPSGSLGPDMPVPQPVKTLPPAAQPQPQFTPVAPAGNVPTFARAPEAGGDKGGFGSLLSAIQQINSKPVDVTVQGQVSGQLTGEVHQTMNINPSPLFVAKMDEVKKIALTGAAHAPLGKSASGPTGVTK